MIIKYAMNRKLVSRRLIYIFFILASIGVFVIFIYAVYAHRRLMARQEPVQDWASRLFIQQPDIVDTWQNVSRDGDFYVYSSYIEGTIIRIIGIASLHSRENLFCQVWSRNSTDYLVLHTSGVRRVDIPEHHSRKFTAAYFICNIFEGTKPIAVSMTSNESCKAPRNVILISGPPKSNYVDFAVCVAPVQSQYDQPYRLVEWIELHRILGAEHFVFYNHRITREVKNVLDYYSSIGLVKVLPWSLPVPTKQIHYFAQLVAINECLYRNRDSAKYIVYADLDEFIIPRRENVTLWKTMMSELPKSNAYMFRHVSFGEAWSGDSGNNSGIAPKSRLVTLSKMKRDTMILPGENRSKMIVVPRFTETAGIHFVWNMTGGTHVVRPEIGLLHHYRRVFENDLEETDTTMLKYKSDLIGNVEKTWATLQ